ncbi:MAG: hypothetical protein AAFX46_21985, partial [Cyanobacteria bacterium J06636_27]
METPPRENATGYPRDNKAKAAANINGPNQSIITVFLLGYPVAFSLGGVSIIFALIGTALGV